MKLGVFIFDIKTKTFNNSDFRLNELYINLSEDSKSDDHTYSESEIFPEHTNIYEVLHNKNIYYSCTHNNQIYLNIEDDIYKYDSGELINLNLKSDYAIKLSNDILFRLYKNKVNMYNINTKNIINIIDVCDDNEEILFWEIYDDKLIIICNKYENPYGQIYKETHDEEFKYRNMKIKSYDIKLLLK